MPAFDSLSADNLRARRKRMLEMVRQYPDAAARDARTILEMVCVALLRQHGEARPPDKLEAKVQLLRHRKLVPASALSHITVVQTYGNTHSHYHDLEPTPLPGRQDVMPCVSALDCVLQWYFTSVLNEPWGAPAVELSGMISLATLEPITSREEVTELDDDVVPDTDPVARYIDTSSVHDLVSVAEAAIERGCTRIATGLLIRAASLLEEEANANDTAAAVLARLAYIAPDDELVLRRLVPFYLARKDGQRALRHLRVLLSIVGKQRDVLEMFATAYEVLGDREKARRFRDAARQLDR